MGVVVEVRPNGFGEGPNELLCRFKMAHLEEGGLPFHVAQFLVRVLQRGFCGGLGVMGEHGQEQKVGYAGRLEFLETASDAGVAVSHGKLKLNVVVDGSQVLGDPLGVDAKRRSVFHPDAFVERSDFSRPGSQDDATNQKVAKRGWNVNDVGVKEEFTKVRSDRRHRGLVGCTDVHQKNTFLPHGRNSFGAHLTVCSRICSVKK